MQNVRLNESQAGIKTAGRNINNLRYEDNTTLVAETEEKLKSLLMKVKEESEKASVNSRLKNYDEDYLGVPVHKTLSSQCRVPGYDPWSGN